MTVTERYTYKPKYQEIDSSELMERGCRPNSCQPRSFLKWAGSKRLLLKHILAVLPTQYGTYFEPFLGSGAVYFLLLPSRAVLSDTCRELIETFLAVRDDVDSIVQYLATLKPNKTLYYQIRENRSKDPVIRAAEFIYLNKTCWNGLYRVNLEGRFNVPFGKPRTDFILDFENIRQCATTLGSPGTGITVCDFEHSISSAKRGDLVYLDPPYVTGHNNNGFTMRRCFPGMIRFAWQKSQLH
jgi:DNA adenine methylase